MKIFYKIFISFFILTSLVLFNSCDPFGDFNITLSMDTELNTLGAGSNISISSDICLDDFDDYRDNRDNLEEIRYLTSAYMTINSSTGLRGDNARLKLYQSDGTTLLFDYSLPTFVPGDYINNPLQIKLTQQEIDNINRYLVNHKVNNCFKAVLQVSNVQYQGTTYNLNAKFEFVTELKVKP